MAQEPEGRHPVQKKRLVDMHYRMGLHTFKEVKD